MYLKKVQISHFRNIDSADLELADHFNYIIGDNGAGKTSLLEAISYLARGKSFKTSDHTSLISDGQDHFMVVGTGNHDEVVGLRRSDRETQVRINGRNVTRLSDLARLVPLFVITPNTHELIERGPDQRRQFIDWGLFHVEQSYAVLMQNYRKALKQRNASLRTDFVNAPYWDKGLAEAGERIDHFRRGFVEQLTPLFLDTVSRFQKIRKLSLDYQPGWKREEGLLYQLQAKTASDKKTGRTSVGPHRADLVIRIDGNVARERLSRGQQKLVVTSLVIAQARLLTKNGLRPTILVDDLPSELDYGHQVVLLKLLDAMPAQKIVTSIDDHICSIGESPGVFHVEHGAVKPV